jgi:hypothetical protein
MRAMTLQDHIDPLVQKIQKCYAPGCGPKSIQVMFTKPAGYIRDFEPVWVCSSGHCSDYEDIPSLRKPEDDPYAWIQKNIRELMNFIEPMKCDEHAAMNPNYVALNLSWGQEGHLWVSEGELCLCLPQSSDKT